MTDARACEVHDDIHIVKGTWVKGAGGWVPCEGFARGGALWGSAEHPNAMTGKEQRLLQCGTDESCSAGDEPSLHFHSYLMW